MRLKFGSFQTQAQARHSEELEKAENRLSEAEKGIKLSIFIRKIENGKDLPSAKSNKTEKNQPKQ